MAQRIPNYLISQRYDIMNFKAHFYWELYLFHHIMKSNEIFIFKRMCLLFFIYICLIIFFNASKTPWEVLITLVTIRNPLIRILFIRSLPTAWVWWIRTANVICSTRCALFLPQRKVFNISLVTLKMIKWRNERILHQMK